MISNTDNIDTSQILAAHKLIPAHVNGMVPFGNLFYLIFYYIKIKLTGYKLLSWM